jgi:Arc/MetJ family transcription regulator
MYPSRVKRLQISIEVELDDALAAEAARRGVSKAALIREFVRERLVDGRPRARDPLDDLVGASDAEPGDIDEVVYGG